jgi:hypothetical protein
VANYVHINERTDYGRGKAGFALGPPVLGYRVQANAAVNYLDTANKLAGQLNIYRKPITPGKTGETPDQMHVLFYELLFNAGPSTANVHYEVGDVFVENDPFYGQGATETQFAEDQFEGYALAYHGTPGHKIIGARLDRVANVFRPATGPTTDSIGPYFQQGIGGGAELPLILTSGVFSFGTNGATPAGIPVGVTTYSREFGQAFKGVPGSTNSVRYFFYLPPLNGVQLKEGDRLLIDGTSESLTTAGRYVVHGPWVQYAGISGYQLVCERMISND